LVVFFLKGASKSLSVELEGYFQILGKQETSCSKQAVSKARMKLKHEAFIVLNDAALEEYCNTNYKTYKGYRLLAVDGSMIELPSGESIREEYGSSNNSKQRVNCGWSVVFYDVLNEMIVSAKLHKYGISERQYLLEQANQIKTDGKQKRDLIIADRGFPSLAVFVQLQQMGYDFLIRYNGEQFLRELKEIATSDNDDMVIEATLDGSDKRRKNAELQELLRKGTSRTMKLRVVKIKLPSGENEYLVTSVLDSQELQKDDLKQIYGYRWSEEEHFKFQKHSVELENFSGKTSESILQDYYSKILILNLHSVLVQEAEKQLAEEQANKKDELKYERYKINRNISYGLVHREIIALLNSENGDWMNVYDELIKKIKRYKTPVISGRSNPRKRKWTLKYPPNKRRAI
jgi:hypothetical protein